MSDPVQNRIVPVPDALMTLLRWLGRPKAVLLVSPHRAEVVRLTKGRIEPTAWSARVAVVVDEGLARGLLASADVPQEAVGRDGVRAFQLSALGRAQLVLHLKTAPGMRRRPPKAPKSSTHSQAAKPRSSPRATLLAQLQARKDRSGHPLLSACDVRAAERLAEDFNRGGLQPRVTANWDLSSIVDRSARLQPDSARFVADGTSAAQERFRRALDHVGAGLGGLLVDVCCLELRLEQIEAERDWARGTARTVLQIALRTLAAHYGFAAEQASGRGEGKIRAWQTPDYRPDAARWRVPARPGR